MSSIEPSNDLPILSRLEASIRLGAEGYKAARGVLVDWLREYVEDEKKEKSISELVISASEGARSKDILPVILRCIAVPDLLPTTTVTNEFQRAVVSLANVPELVDYLRIDQKSQTYIKYQALEGAHSKICETLSPLITGFSDIETALSARRSMIGVLNHSVIRLYGGIFDSRKVKEIVEDIFYKLKRVSEVGQTLLLDVEECRRSVAEGLRQVEESGSFLALDFLKPLLLHIAKALEKFIAGIRGKFTTAIVAGFRGELAKRYPIHEAGRSIQISVPFRNVGPGLAVSLKATSSGGSGEDVLIENPTIHLGNVQPGEFSIVLDLFVVDPVDRFSVTILLEWSEIGESSLKSSIHEFVVVAQAKNVDWASKEYWRPYSTEPAEGENFVGRIERVRSLAAKILRSPMESFFLTGQKRVGKTSLALACIEFAKAQEQSFEIIDSYNLWGSFAHVDAAASLNALGSQIEGLIKGEVRSLIHSPSIDFSGSLAPLVGLAGLAMKLAPEKRFVIVIDEFDEIHQELYLFGNLAETFFANLRALSRCKNICFVLVGGENMPYVMERQGQKLNNFSRASLSYYGREAEWSDFKLMIQRPVSAVINWHDDAIAEVFNISNGNPYFAKLICAAALELAVQERDTDVTVREVRHAAQMRISSLGANSFAHLWQDGIPKPLQEREPDILLRQRVLVAIARCYKAGDPPVMSSILLWRAVNNISEGEVSAVLNDFARREVIVENQGIYSFCLPIFEHWLSDVGVAQLAADALTAELANAALAEELALAVRSDEIASLVEAWPTYRGRHIGSEEVRSWIQQVDGSRNQRLLFDILSRVNFLSEARVREMLGQSFSFLQPLPEFVIRRRSDRRRNIIVTYVDGEGKSGYNYASVFAEVNLIAADCIFPPGEFSARYSKHKASGDGVDAVVIVDDLVGTGKSLLGNIERFLDKHGSVIGDSVPIRLISIVASVDGQKKVLEGLGRLEKFDLNFKSCYLLGDRDYAFSDSRAGWRSDEDFERAKSLCTDIGKRIYGTNPLGFGNKGLLLVFPTNAPNNSLPILHSPSRGVAGRAWKPLFLRVTH